MVSHSLFPLSTESVSIVWDDDATAGSTRQRYLLKRHRLHVLHHSLLCMSETVVRHEQTMNYHIVDKLSYQLARYTV